ncbi:DUF1674 domain-containing protein [Rhizobium sp. TRM95111]|uniref:DUF1674 domain-containing protein n=1 Tax=Rhizobium alarense TaxID=2846851 RepID=UPI001F15A098|nr:DUF1674 domain-containing protein [Rhizobium alarense]MCF3639984.1 DUF1674 domain-containing protein [Rhizobium alarense]
MQSDNDNSETKTRRILSPAAARALKEAEERRKDLAPASPAPEFGGRGGADPARFGDWEINGRAIDF